MMRRAFETVALDRLRRIGEACPLCLFWVQPGPSPMSSKKPLLSQRPCSPTPVLCPGPPQSQQMPP